MAKGGFRGMPGGMNQAAMMKQVQKMQQDMMRMQEELENKTYTASAGGGVVKAEVNGKNEIVSLAIDPEAVDPDDVEMLQDMVIAAVNEALRNAEADKANNMSRMTGGLNLGGLF
ncbi:MAG: YbaB/EbfC family nucleoid-associated protein [Oscillospiraceae bacterium]|nr:YbaB/EbfC family nucleoid-associated protein [Oscillospiraceae bacterium]